MPKGSSDYKADYKGEVSPQLSMKQFINLNEEDCWLVKESELEMLMMAYLILPSQSLLYSQKITKILKIEIKDEGKAKITKELTSLKWQCVVNKEALENEWDVVRRRRLNLIKKHKSWRNYCLDSKKKSKDNVKELNVVFTKEKNRRKIVKVESLKYKGLFFLNIKMILWRL